MNDSSPEALAKALHAHALKLIRRNGGHLWGTVSSVQGTVPPTLTVTLAGSATPVPGVTYLESYSPAGMDSVLIAALKNGDLCVVGVKASASGGGGGGGGGGGISWPLIYSGDMGFEPDGSSNQALLVTNDTGTPTAGLQIIGGDTAGGGSNSVTLLVFGSDHSGGLTIQGGPEPAGDDDSPINIFGQQVGLYAESGSITVGVGSVVVIDAGSISVGGARGALVGLYTASPIVQPAAITAPTGGATVDSEARTAITAILNALSQAAGGIGITA